VTNINVFFASPGAQWLKLAVRPIPGGKRGSSRLGTFGIWLLYRILGHLPHYSSPLSPHLGRTLRIAAKYAVGPNKKKRDRQ
jgi:hypothetical protein